MELHGTIQRVHGPPGLEVVLSFLGPEKRQYIDARYHQIFWKRFTTARVVSGHLMFRTEHERTVFLHSTPFRELEYLIDAGHLRFCQHPPRQSWYSTFERVRIDEIIREELLHFPDTETCGGSGCSEVVACTGCATEFQVRGAKLADGQTTLRFTVWQDLGESDSPFDRAWGNL